MFARRRNREVEVFQVLQNLTSNRYQICEESNFVFRLIKSASKSITRYSVYQKYLCLLVSHICSISKCQISKGMVLIRLINLRQPSTVFFSQKTLYMKNFSYTNFRKLVYYIKIAHSFFFDFISSYCNRPLQLFI